MQPTVLYWTSSKDGTIDTLCTDLAEVAQEVYMHAVVHVAELMSAISRLMYDNCSELPGTEVTSSPNLPAV